MPRILKILGYPHDTKYHALCRRANEHTDHLNILPQNNQPVKKPKDGLTLWCFISPVEIVTASYIPEGSWDLVTVEHIPITDAQWQMMKSTVEQLPLEKARSNIWEKQKLDGSEFRELTLAWGKKEITYYWPNTPEAQQLEALLEALLYDCLPSATEQKG